ncbi:MAG: hypothetical protein ACLRFR_02470 [Clostridia bacterium]
MNKITQKQTPETDEALKQLQEKKKQQASAYTVTYFFTCPFLLWIVFDWISTKQLSQLGLIGGIILLLIIGIVELCLKNALVPYKKQLRLAQRNDEIRHEERVRFYERKALEAGEHTQPTNFNLKRYQQLMETKRKIIEQETKDIKGE